MLYVLDCAHLVDADPDFIEDGDKLPCVNGQCHRLRKIKGVHVYEWHVRCNVCTWGGWTGTSEALAWQRGRGHTANRQHSVTVLYERNPIAVNELARLRRAGLLCRRNQDGRGGMMPKAISLSVLRDCRCISQTCSSRTSQSSLSPISIMTCSSWTA